MAVQPLILVVDTSHRIDREAFAQLQEGLQLFFDELEHYPELSETLQACIQRQEDQSIAVIPDGPYVVPVCAD